MLHRLPFSEDPWRDGLFDEIHFHIPAATWFDSGYMYMRKCWRYALSLVSLEGQELSRSFSLSHEVARGWRGPLPNFQLSVETARVSEKQYPFSCLCRGGSTWSRPGSSWHIGGAFGFSVLLCMLLSFSTLCDDAPFCVVHRLECSPRGEPARTS